MALLSVIRRRCYRLDVQPDLLSVPVHLHVFSALTGLYLATLLRCRLARMPTGRGLLSRKGNVYEVSVPGRDAHC